MFVAGFQGVEKQGRHHARPRRIGHHRGRPGRRAERRRVRDLHRRRRHLHDRPAHRPARAQGLDRISYDEMLELASLRRQGPDAALRGIRPSLRRSDSRSVVVHRQARHSRQRIDGGHPDGRRHPDRSRARPQRGQGHRRRLCPTFPATPPRCSARSPTPT